MPAPEATKEQIDRINAISQNARGTWFGLLGALVFAGVTILGVKDIDFFTLNQATKLPLIGVSVPVEYFFGAGSLLVTALYIYLHLYLELLWTALGKAGPRVNGDPLSEHIFPWLISDWALRRRDALRKAKGKDRASADRTMGWVASAITVTFVWIFGLVILAMFWWWSHTRQDLWMSLGIGALLTAASFIAWRSWFIARGRLGEQGSINWMSLRPELLFAVLAMWLGYFSAFFAILHPLGADLRETQITERPADWQDYNEAEKAFRAKWAKQEKLILRTPFAKTPSRNMEAAYKDDLLQAKNKHGAPDFDEQRFRNEWAIKHQIALQNPFAPTPEIKQEQRFKNAWRIHRNSYIANLPKPELDNRGLRRANLREAFLVGISLRRANLSHAELQSARLERANLFRARLERAVLNSARLEWADLSWARLGRANLIEANLSRARLIGSQKAVMNLNSTDLKEANFSATALRYVDLSRTDLTKLRNFGDSFGDASVRLPQGTKAPCQWGKGTLNDREYYGRWRGC